MTRNALAGVADGEALLFARFLRKLPSLWRQEKSMAQHGRQGWRDNRIFVDDGCGYLSIYSPDDLESQEGGYVRTYNIFCHMANAWFHRKEVMNFIQSARGVRRFADVGSAEGFYSALFASMHRTQAEILSIDCGSTAGCNPAHTPIVLRQNAEEFKPSRWDYIRAFVTDSARREPSFPLPEDCRIATLPEIMADSGFVPELIKMDIESSEYEVLLDSLEWLEATAPMLIIEVHNAFLASRGLDFAPVLEALKRIGYRLVGKDHGDYLRVDSHLVLEPAR